MEIHRLTERPQNFNEALFNKLYYKTMPLRMKLASQVDCKRLGLTHDIIVSYFDDKFIHAFYRYCNEPENILKANILRALANFKNRILRKAYTVEAEARLSQIEITENEHLVDTLPDTHQEDQSSMLELALSYLKEELSQEAYLILELELTRPEFISNRVSPKAKRIPTKVLIEYFELEDTKKASKKILALYEEVEMAKISARQYFKV